MILLKLLVYEVIFISSFAAASLRVQAFKKALIAQQRQQRSLPEKNNNDDGSGSLLTTNRTVAQRLPRVLLIGVRKCGTRALLEFLNLHPLIAAASDEVHFFDNDTMYEQGLDAYRAAMPFTFEDQLTIEKTPAYFSRGKVPARVKSLDLDDLKFIVVFRDPVTRTISDYTQVLSNRRLRNITFPPFEHMAFRKKRSLDDVEDDVHENRHPEINRRYKAINISTYAYHMKNWLEYFPLEKFHFVDGDRLVSDPIVELRQVERFLGLPHAIGSDLLYFNKTRGFYCMKVPLGAVAIEQQRTTARINNNNNNNEANNEPDDVVIFDSSEGIHYKNKCLRPDKGRQHPTIDERFIKQLKNYFRPLNQALFDTIHKKFDWN